MRKSRTPQTAKSLFDTIFISLFVKDSR
jgi:hypothetical protein